MVLATVTMNVPDCLGGLNGRSHNWWLVGKSRDSREHCSASPPPPLSLITFQHNLDPSSTMTDSMELTTAYTPSRFAADNTLSNPQVTEKYKLAGNIVNG